MNAHRFNSFKGRFHGNSNQETDFAGLNHMTTLSDKKDILKFTLLNSSSLSMENSLEFLKTVQNEIYTGLTQEVEDLRVENKDMKTKLIFLTNSTDILDNFPTIDPITAMDDKGAKAKMLNNYIEELKAQLLKEVEIKRELEAKLYFQEKEIWDLKLRLDNKSDGSLLTKDSKENLPTTKSFITSFNRNDNWEVKNFKTQFHEPNPSLPTTIFGCHSMIKALVKLRNKMDSEMNTLRRKLNNGTSSSFKTGANSHNYNYILYKPSSDSSVTSNHNRFSILRSIFKS